MANTWKQAYFREERCMMSFARKRISTLLKSLCFLVVSFPLTSLLFAFSSEKGMDLEIILSGIQYYDSLIKSGEGDVTYRRIQTAGLTDAGSDMTHEYHLIFNQRKTRMDIPEHILGKLHFPKLTYINTEGKGEWKIQYDKSRTHYTYSTTSNGTFRDWDPRWIMTTIWQEGSVYEHLKKGNFKVKQKQNLGKIECYVLENPDREEKIWIAPDLGFRFLKYEHKFALEVDLPRRGMKKGTPMVTRRWASYQKYGEAWFPKQTTTEASFIDEKGQEHLLSKTQHETKNFRLNHKIPKKRFTIKIPEDAQIWVADLRTFMSKKKFLKYYNMK